MNFTRKHIFLIIGLIIFITGWIYSTTTDNPQLGKSITLGSIIVFFWLTEALPMYVTAMFPLVFAVPMGLLDLKQVSAAYSHKFVILFLGGFLLALAMEKWDVHKQIAHGIIGFVGTSKLRILLGFILSTALLSMWISNTATTLMMLPMATAVILNMQKKDSSKFPLFLVLSIAYAASIGGMATLVGSPPNSAMAGILADNYGIQMDFMDWMKVGLPLCLILLSMLFVFFSWKLRKEKGGDKLSIELEKKPWTRQQITVISVFMVVVLLWAFRKLIIGYFHDWGYEDFYFGDENVAVMGAILMFVLPGKKGEALLQWKDTQKLAWGILILFGGGFALAEMLKVNGAIDEVVLLFKSFETWSVVAILFVIVAISVFGTEIMSNTALVTVFIPVIAQFATNANFPILQLCLPVALSASCAFMLPVGTPPNAIVFSSGQVTVKQMARNGLMLNIMAVVIVVIFSLLFLS